jgi:hypothetical protein
MAQSEPKASAARERLILADRVVCLSFRIDPRPGGKRSSIALGSMEQQELHRLGDGINITDLVHIHRGENEIGNDGRTSRPLQHLAVSLVIRATRLALACQWPTPLPRSITAGV